MSDPKEGSHIDIITSAKAPYRARRMAGGLESLFNGPLFAKLVRDAVEEMILEGKLEYDMETDTLEVPEDRVRRWAAKMEKRYWSRRRRSKTS